MDNPKDIRPNDPNQSPLRRGNFRDGWTHAVTGGTTPNAPWLLR